MSSATYYLIDPPSSQAGPAGGQTGGGSGKQIVDDFVADTIAHAAQVAYIISSALQRPVGLVTKFAAPGTMTIVVGIGATNALTSVPSGIGY